MNPREIAKLVAGNLMVLIVLLAIGSLVLRGIGHLQNDWAYSGASLGPKPGYDGHTIRASYPPYRDFDPEYAKAIFTEQEAPAVRYVPFTGWRRKSHDGTAVNIEDEYRTRLSTNHQVDDSVWFLGGSTMWGTGADDRNTIPSIYAELSGEPVWNLGEGGYNSFQELVRLMELLAKGLKPRLVVFYDGTNEDLYCSANNHRYPTHRRAEQWEKYIREYPKLERAYRDLKQRQERDSEWAKRVSVFAELKRTVGSVARFFAAPYVNLYRKATDKRILGREESDNLSSDTPFKEFRAKAAYQTCDRSPEKRELAARTTVETWLLASSILKSRGIKFKIFLQPTARVAPETLNLDYIIDVHKQRIADTTASHTALYKEIKRIWSKSCAAYDACDAFHDISNTFRGSRDPVFIDHVHLAPPGQQDRRQKNARNSQRQAKIESAGA